MTSFSALTLLKHGAHAYPGGSGKYLGPTGRPVVHCALLQTPGCAGSDQASVRQHGYAVLCLQVVGRRMLHYYATIQ